MTNHLYSRHPLSKQLTTEDGSTTSYIPKHLVCNFLIGKIKNDDMLNLYKYDPQQIIRLLNLVDVRQSCFMLGCLKWQISFGCKLGKRIRIASTIYEGSGGVLYASCQQLRASTYERFCVLM